MVSWLLVFGLLQTPGTPLAREERTQEPLVLHAAVLEAQLGEKPFLEARGQVEFLYGKRRLFTEQIFWDSSQEVVWGTTPLRLIGPEGELRGERFEYFYREGRGWFEKARLEMEGGRVGASRIEVAPSIWSAYHAQVTTCDKEHPDYLLTAERVRLDERGKLRASQVRLKWKGRTLLTLPALSLRLRKEASELRLPQPTYSRLTGFGLRWRESLLFGARSECSVLATGYLRFRPESQLRLAWNLGRREPPAVPQEEGARFQQGYLESLLEPDPEAERERLAELQPWLALQRIANVRAFGRKEANLFVTKPWEIGVGTPIKIAGGMGSLTLRVGALEEQRAQIRIAQQQRLSLEGEWLWQVSNLNQRLSNLRFRLQAAAFLYEGKDRFGWMRPQIEWLLTPSEGTQLAVGYGHSFQVGDTPFLFDTIDARQEVRLRVGTQLGNFRIGLLFKYDLEVHTLLDVQLLLGSRQHCLEPYLFWRKVPSEWRFGIGLTSVR